MDVFLRRIAGLALVSSAVFAGSPAPAIPGTTAGKVFARWLDVFNKGDRAELKAFAEQFSPGRVDKVDDELGFRKMTGGFDLIRIVDSAENALTAIVKEREGSNFAKLNLQVEPQEPHRIKALGLEVTGADAGEPAQARIGQAEAVEALKAKLVEAAAKGTFSGAVLIMQNGKMVLSGAYGLADRANHVSNTLDTQFRVGSMNKMFTATATLQLAQAGKLRLTDPIGKYLTDYPNPEVASKVTVHHLLTHTGGTGDIFGPEYEKHRLELKELRDYVALYGKRGLEFEPGARHAYSNYGFLLLGVLIERVSGQSYYDYVRDHIFAPAGMALTDSLPETGSVKGRSVGYTNEDGEPKPNTDTLPYRGTSAGGGYSTVGDLVRFAGALASGKLLDAEHLKLMTTGKVDAPRGAKYAYGFIDSRANGVHWYGHGGGAPGMNGDLRIYPETGYVVAVLANLDPPAATAIADFVDKRWPVAAN